MNVLEARVGVFVLEARVVVGLVVTTGNWVGVFVPLVGFFVTLVVVVGISTGDSVVAGQQ